MTSSKGSSSTKNSNSSLVKKYLKAPLRVVIGVGDLCLHSLTTGGNNVVVYGNSMGCPTPTTPSPSKYSPPENRAKMMLKTSTTTTTADNNLLRPSRPRGKVAPATVSPRRSHASVGRIDRIDEEVEETSDFDEQE